MAAAPLDDVLVSEGECTANKTRFENYDCVNRTLIIIMISPVRGNGDECKGAQLG